MIFEIMVLRLLLSIFCYVTNSCDNVDIDSIKNDTKSLIKRLEDKKNHA